MNLFKKIASVALAAFMFAVTATGALAYSTVYPMEYGQPRIGAYTSVFPYNQGMYNYLTPPIALTRYGAEYDITNIRTAIYPQFPFTYHATITRPYMGYPYGIDRSPTVLYSSYGGAGGFHYSNYGGQNYYAY
jgi:hypothetical protein